MVDRMSLFEILQCKALIIWPEVLVAFISLSSSVFSKYIPGTIGLKIRSLTLHTSLWLLANIYFRTAPDHVTAVWAGNVNAIAFVILPFAFLDFVQHLLPPVTIQDRKILYSMPLPIIINIVLILTTETILINAVPSFWGWASRPGYLFPFYALTMFGYSAVGFLKILKVYPGLNEVDKNRLKYFLTSIAIMGVSTFTNILLPFGVPFPHGILGIALGMAVGLYAVADDRVWDYPYFLGRLAARGFQFFGALLIALAVECILDRVENLRLPALELLTIIAFGAGWYLLSFLISAKRFGNALLKQLDPKKASIYRAIEKISTDMEYSRQPEMWLSEMAKILGSKSPVFVPFEARFPHPCPPMDPDHPLRKKLSCGRGPVFIKPIDNENPCPAYDFNPSEIPTNEFAVPIYGGDKPLGAILFGPDLGVRLYSSNAVDRLMRFAGEMGKRLADESPAKGKAKIISLAKGNREVIDEEPFDSIEDLKSSEFFHFYLPAMDSTIEIEFVEGDKITKIV